MYGPIYILFFFKFTAVDRGYKPLLYPCPYRDIDPLSKPTIPCYFRYLLMQSSCSSTQSRLISLPPNLLSTSVLSTQPQQD